MIKMQIKPKNNTQSLNVNGRLLDLIAPSSIDEQRNNVWLGDQLCQTMVITRYPSSVAAGWLSRLSNTNGVVVRIHVDPTNSADIVKGITQSIRSESDLDSRSVDKRLAAEKKYNDSLDVIEQIQDNERVYYVTVVITVTGKNEQNMKELKEKVEATIADMSVRVADFAQSQGLLATSPYGPLLPSIKGLHSRNMTAKTLAATIPYASSGHNDGMGIVLGRDVNGGIILVDSWKKKEDRSNSNWVIFGPSGTGKSTTVKKLLLSEYARGTKIYIIDPEGEYKHLRESIGAQWIDCGGGSGDMINPLEVRRSQNVDPDNDDDAAVAQKDQYPLAGHIYFLRTLFQVYFGNELSRKESAVLEDELLKLYARHGITLQTSADEMQYKTYPTMSDLYNQLQQSEHNDLALIVRSAAVGADKLIFNGQTTVNISSNVIIFDISRLLEADKTLKTTQMYNVTSWIWNEMVRNRQEQAMLVVDESHLLIDPEVRQTAVFLKSVSKRIRKYEGSLVLITQPIIDFLHDKVRDVGQALIDNPSYKLFLGLEGRELKEMTELYNLSAAEAALLSKKRKGHGLLMLGAKRVHAKIEIAAFEFELMGTGGGR